MTGVSFQYGTMIRGDGVSSAPEFEVMSEHPVLQDTLELGDQDVRDVCTTIVGRRPRLEGWLAHCHRLRVRRPSNPRQAAPIAGHQHPRDPNWRSNWDSIIPADLSVGNRPTCCSTTGAWAKASCTASSLRARSPCAGSTRAGGAAGTRSSRALRQYGFGGLLFYDRVRESASSTRSRRTVYRVAAGARWLAPSWDQIVQGNFGGSGDSDLLFYDRARA